MIKFNLRLVLRNFRRQRMYSIINLTALSVGLAGTFILTINRTNATGTVGTGQGLNVASYNDY